MRVDMFPEHMLSVGSLFHQKRDTTEHSINVESIRCHRAH
jgi:hypothetical protein